MSVGTPTARQRLGQRASAPVRRSSMAPKYAAPPAPANTNRPPPANNNRPPSAKPAPAVPRLPKSRQMAAQRALASLMRSAMGISPYALAAVAAGIPVFAMNKKEVSVEEGIDHYPGTGNWVYNFQGAESSSFNKDTGYTFGNQNPLIVAHQFDSVNLYPQAADTAYHRMYMEQVPGIGQYLDYYSYTIVVRPRNNPGPLEWFLDPLFPNPGPNPFIKTAPQFYPQQNPWVNPRPKYRRLPSMRLRAGTVQIDATANTLTMQTPATASRPRGRVTERKQRSKLTQILAILLDYGSEALELFEIVAEAAGVSLTDRNGKRRPYSEVLVDLIYDTTLDDVDWGELALGVVKNYFEDQVAGRTAKAGQRSMRKLGFTSYQLP